MKLGIALPLIDIGGDPATVRDFAQAAEALGYDHLGAPDHVLGVNVATRPDWGQRNTSMDFFHDPFVLFGFLSACTTTIGFLDEGDESCRSGRPHLSPSRQLHSMFSLAAGSASASVLVGTPSNT